MSTKLRVFLYNPATPKAPAAKAEDVVLTSDGDAAKREARLYLEKSGMVVRSLNWAPDPGKTDMLVGYGVKKG